jgi:hypothetical protein
MDEQRHQEGTPPSGQQRIGLRWELAEIEQLIDGIAHGLSIAQLANCHERTPGAITSATKRLLPVERRPEARKDALSAFVLYLSEKGEVDERSLAAGYFTHSEKAIPPAALKWGERPAALDLIPTRSDGRASGVDVEDAFNLVAEAVQWVKDDRDREVLYRRLGIIGEPQTLAEIGTMMRVSGERIRQLQNRALASLAHHAHTEGSPGNTLRSLLAVDEGNPHALVEKLLDIAAYFETTLGVSSLFTLRTSGFSLEQTSAMVELANVTLQARLEAELAAQALEDQLQRDTAAAYRVESMISRWLAQADWPPSADAPPSREQLQMRRKVGDSGTSGTFWSTKLARPVSYESSTEREILNTLDRSEQIAYYQEQPFEIPYAFDGQPRRYFPDIFAVTIQGSGLLIEVKPLPNMALSLSRAKAEAGRAWAHQHGWGWISIDARGTFADLISHVIASDARSHLDRELRVRGRLTWPEVLTLRNQHGLSALDITAYVIQTDARLTLEPRYEIAPSAR